jgi:hypothetical protein
MQNVKLNFGRNDKMKKTEKLLKENYGQDVRIHTFNLPAIDACPGAGNCKSFCYATQGRYIFSNVAQPREENFSILKNIIRSGESEDMIVAEIATILKENIVETFSKRLRAAGKRNIIRIHDSGDFFHKNYFLGWCRALQELKLEGCNIEGYAYTKSLRILKPLFEQKPENLHIIFSVGGLWDAEIDQNLPHSRVFTSAEELKLHNYVDGSYTDIPAIQKEIKIGLIYHGTKSVNSVQKFIV